MSLFNIHKMLALAYFLPPLLFYLTVEDLKIANIDLDSSVAGPLATSITLFALGLILTVRLFSKALSTRIETSLEHLTDSIQISKLSFLQIFCLSILFYYLFEITVKTQSIQGRDELFNILQESLGPLFMLAFKIGVFLSVVSLLKKTNYFFVTAFFATVFLINLLTLSRSMILVMVIALLPFLRIKPLYVFSGFVIIFMSRFIFMGNISLDAEWLRIYGFGEMLGVTFGPYAVLQSGGLNLSLIEHFGFVLHTLPGFSTIATYGLGVPEMVIFVNQFTLDSYGLYGVAGTGYLDALVAPIVFIYLCIVIAFTFIFFRFSKESGMYRVILSCAFIASAIATTQLYRWSLSGFMYTTLRDTLIFIVVFLVIRKGTMDPS